MSGKFIENDTTIKYNCIWLIFVSVKVFTEILKGYILRVGSYTVKYTPPPPRYLSIILVAGNLE